MGVKDIAEHYKVSPQHVRQQARREDWVSPTKVNQLRREIEAKQRAIWKRSGKATDVAAVKAQIWDERGDMLKEKTYEIVKAALEGVTPAQAKNLIRNPLGLSHITTVVRQITGEEAKEAQEGTKVAVNIGLLRSSRVLDAPAAVVEAELVE
jgi:two-component sensor histidine kinase